MRLIGIDFFKSLSARTHILIVSALLLTALSTTSFVFSMQKHIEIVDGENSPIEIVVYTGTVEEALKKGGVALNEGDKLNVAADLKATDSMKIQVFRAMPVTITANGETKDVLTTKRTVREILTELGFHVADTDITDPGAGETVSQNSHISFIKTSEDILTTQVAVEFEKKEKNNPSLAAGHKKVVQEGKAGLQELSYKVVYHDGAEVSRELIDTKVIEDSVDMITEIGTKGLEPSYVIASRGVMQTSRSGEIRYSKVLSVTATAYNLSYESTGKRPGQAGYGITATGMQARRGVIAVDPKVIPLHSRLYIEAPDGSWVYGTAVAGDTGGAIKGNKIDLFFDTRSEVMQFGRRQAKVYILE